MINVYLACALTHVPKSLFEEYAIDIHNLAFKLKNDQFAVKYALTDSDPQLSSISKNKQAKTCYEMDKAMVLSSDIIIAECTYASIGLGIELQIAATEGIPIILCHKDTNKAEKKRYLNPDNNRYDLQIGEGYISLMALGLPTVKAAFEYVSIHELYSNLKSEINTL